MSFEALLREEERAAWAGLSSPAHIQAFLDGTAYTDDALYRCPLRTLRERRGHCFDGALFAAAALRCLGYPPLIVELLPNERDDDHLLAVYRQEGYWGALAKSNFVGLRYREPVYRTLRELVMSYFEAFFNALGEKTLRGYTAPLSLKAFDRLGWMVRDEPLEAVAARLDEVRRFPVMTSQMAARLAPVDERSRRAGLLGANAAGLFRVTGG